MYANGNGSHHSVTEFSTLESKITFGVSSNPQLLFLPILLVHQTKKELGDSVRSAPMSTILKTVAAVLLAILVVFLLNRMYVQYQTISSLMQEVDLHLKATNGALTKEVDGLKVTNGALKKELDDLKATNGALTKEVDDLKATNGALNKEVDDLKATNGALNKEVDDLKATNGALTKEFEDLKATNRSHAESKVKQLVKDSESNATIQFRDARKFLDSDEKEKLGESFRCSGLSWHLYYKKVYFLGLEENLQVFVCHDISDFFGHTFRDWSANATFDLTMVNHDDKAKSETRNFNNVFEKNSQYHCRGYIFGTISDLYNGFIKDDASDFKLQFNSLQLNLIE